MLNLRQFVVHKHAFCQCELLRWHREHLPEKETFAQAKVETLWHFGTGTRRGLAQDSLGFPGDSRGTRWGFSGDSRTFRGTRTKKWCPKPTFQGDSRETTVGFYNIKKGCLDYTCAISGLSGGRGQAGVCASGW